jgi:hypothetical protein
MPKQLQMFLFCFATIMLKFFGAFNTPLERCFQDLSNGILQAHKFPKSQLLKPKTICSRLATAKHAGQKKHNGKTTLFSISALKEIKVGHLLTIGNVYW